MGLPTARSDCAFHSLEISMLCNVQAMKRMVMKRSSYETYGAKRPEKCRNRTFIAWRPCGDDLTITAFDHNFRDVHCRKQPPQGVFVCDHSGLVINHYNYLFSRVACQRRYVTIARGASIIRRPLTVAASDHGYSRCNPHPQHFNHG